MHLLPHPFELFILFLTLGFTVLVVVALVVFIRAAGARSRQTGGPAPAVRPAAERVNTTSAIATSTVKPTVKSRTRMCQGLNRCTVHAPMARGGVSRR